MEIKNEKDVDKFEICGYNRVRRKIKNEKHVNNLEVYNEGSQNYSPRFAVI